MSCILIIGGAGYGGSVLAEEYLERGYSVRILDRPYFGEAGLAGVRDRFDVIVGNMRNVGPGVFEGVSAGVKVGSLSNDPTAEPNPRANTELNTVAARSSGVTPRADGRVPSARHPAYDLAAERHTDRSLSLSPCAP